MRLEERLWILVTKKETLLQLVYAVPLCLLVTIVFLAPVGIKSRKSNSQLSPYHE